VCEIHLTLMAFRSDESGSVLGLDWGRHEGSGWIDSLSLSLSCLSCPVLAAGNGDATGVVCEIHLKP